MVKLQIVGVFILLSIFTLGCGRAEDERISQRHVSDLDLEARKIVEAHVGEYRSGHLQSIYEIPFHNSVMEVGVVCSSIGARYGFSPRNGLEGRVWIVNSGKYRIYDYGELLFVVLDDRWSRSFRQPNLAPPKSESIRNEQNCRHSENFQDKSSR